MADYDSQLPVRSKQDADERLQTKLVDKDNPDTQQATVDSDSNLKVGVYGDDPAGGDQVLRLSELGAPNPDGDYDGTNNTKPASSQMIASDRGATVDETSQNLRTTGVSGDSDKIALDVAISDSSGNDFTQTNPLPVYVTESPGDEIVDYQTTAAVAKDASTDHDYTVTALKTLTACNAWVSGSGKLKAEVKKETAAASGIFNNVWVGFNSTANPNIPIPMCNIFKQVAGAKVRITITNLDGQAQDLYSTLTGVEE